VDKRRCLASRRVIVVSPAHKNQRYCSDPGCQKVRKARWRKRKMRNDPDYRTNQNDCGRRWREAHRDYRRSYRKSHPDYVEDNRELQRTRNRPARRKVRDALKSDASGSINALVPGTYQLIPVRPEAVAKMDVMNVEIRVLSSG